ncbi:MAG: hypothetical protein HY046_09750 [Acidobacteria bacterium]|nr:hypothetical protein [Acidobacteriota bacterium]
MLSEERRTSILERVARLLPVIDAEVHLHEALLDSTRQQLVIVMQKGELPILLGMNYLDYVSHRDEDLSRLLREGLQKRIDAANRRDEEE